MVSPLYIFGLGLGIAFLLPLFEKLSKEAPKYITLLLLALFTIIPVSWIAQILPSGIMSSPVSVGTIGFAPPFAISLQIGFAEALTLAAVNAAALLSGLYHTVRNDENWKGKHIVLFLTLIVGVNGLILTRDLFNLFVFLEITSISMYALIATNAKKHAYEAGFKYLIAGSLASASYLIGVIFLYRYTGTLYIDEIAAMDLASMAAGNPGLVIALSLLMLAMLVELKPFPANGWAIDAYEASDPAVSAMISAVGATGVLFSFHKLLELFTPQMAGVAAACGMLTFIFSQLIGLRQERVRRMLGYSSVGQIALAVTVLSIGRVHPDLAVQMQLAAALLIGTHIFSKAGLFWLADIQDRDGFTSFRKSPLFIAVIGILVSALAGLPPFPSFWAKWSLLSALTGKGYLFYMALILLGSVCEAGYLFRWFTRGLKAAADPGDIHSEQVPEDVPVAGPQTGVISSTRARAAVGETAARKVTTAVQEAEDEKKTLHPSVLMPLVSALVVTVSGLLFGYRALEGSAILLLPAAVLLVGLLLDLVRIPLKLHLLSVLAGIAYYAYQVLPQLQGIRMIFGVIFLIGSAVQMIILFNRKGVQFGLVPLMTAMVFSLGNLLLASTRLGFFLSWELMTVTSFLLILRGKLSSGAGFRYLLFSLGGAYSILAGLMLFPGFDSLLAGNGAGASAPLAAVILLAVGFLVKMGAAGFHIWLPAAYAEAEDETSALLSSVLSKASLFMLFLTAALYLQPVSPVSSVSVSTLLGWVGTITLIAGSFFALFQEDIKYTLAYSSMGQVGYMLLGFSLMTHLGWTASLYLAVTHLLFKGMLFIAVAGVIHRTRTRMMYQMGGLIKRMPVSFLTVLIGIIALSGVPPLTGFGGKWLIYTALIEKGWYLQAAIAMFASGIAFLYLFRLIHVIFLGQLKDEHRDVKEAPIWYLIPQVIGMVAIMAFSMFPNLLLQPLQAAVAPFFPASISWDGYTVISTLGYWNGNAVMYVTFGVFLIPLAWLLLVRRKHTRLVSQFNIVYAAERPDKPETTHFGYNFFAHYHEALGSFLTPWATRFWGGVESIVHVAGSAVRRIYSGNGQTYAFYILAYCTVVLIIIRGGVL